MFAMFAMFWNGFNTNFDSYGIFSWWDMDDFVLKIPSELRTYNKKYYVRGLCSLKLTGSWGAKPPTNRSENFVYPSQLVIGYLWLAFLKFVLRPQFTMNFVQKFNHISLTENRKTVKISDFSVSEHSEFAHFSHYSKNFDHNWKKKSDNCFFSFV